MAADKKYSGFLGDNYKYLQQGSKDGAKEVWLKPGVMFGRYNKFMVDSVIFFFAEDSEYKGMDPNESERTFRRVQQGYSRGLQRQIPDSHRAGTRCCAHPYRHYRH